jgi:hypothetical protein
VIAAPDQIFPRSDWYAWADYKGAPLTRQQAKCCKAGEIEAEAERREHFANEPASFFEDLSFPLFNSFTVSLSTLVESRKV